MDDAELRHWQEIDHHLTELTKHPGWAALTEYAQFVLMAPVSKRVLNSNENSYSWESYLRDTGWLTGIHDALNAHKVVADKVTHELERRRALAAEE